MKENRIFSFIIIVLVYLLSAVVGIVTYNLLSFSWWLSLLVADIIATVVTYIFSVIFNNASIYDPYWSVQPPVILIAFAVFYGVNLLGALLIVAICLWAIRLTANWAYTFKDLTHQDWRYTMLKEKTGKLYQFVNFTGIHLVPTLVVYSATLPAVYAIVNGVKFHPVCLIFIVLVIFAVILQGIADIQMHKFRRNRTTTFIRNGVWKYSRHPNYLAEILTWWGVALTVVCAQPTAWYLIFGAVANNLLFLCISIPLADGRQSKKEGFMEYKSQTRKLLPIPKK